MFNVLVTASGSIVAQGIIKSLKLANIDQNRPVSYRIVTSDMNSQAVGLYRSDLGVIVPSASSPNYIDTIIKICNEENIKAVFVGSDEELLLLAQSKKHIESETDATIITNPVDTITNSTDKWKTFEFLKKNNLSYTESSLPENKDEFVNEFGFPVVVKPREGHGSLHFYIANNMDEVEQAISSICKVGWRPLLQEYLKDEDSEFTSGVTVDRTGKHVMSSIAMQKIIKNGQTNKAFVDDFDNVRKDAEKTALKIGSTGAVNIQAMQIGDQLKIFEINPRFSATCPIRAVAGINEPDIVFRNMVLGEDIKIEHYQKLVCMRYWNEVYVPYSTYEKTHSSGRVEKADSFIPYYF